MVLTVALAAPATNVYSQYFLQDLAYHSVDADEDGQPDKAVAVAANQPASYPYFAPYAPYAPYYGAPTVAVADDKTLKTLPIAAPFNFAPYNFAPYSASTFGYSFVTPFHG